MTLPNGVWNGSLIWSQCDDAILLHALPTTDCTNLMVCDMYSHIDGHGAHVDTSHAQQHHHTTTYETATTAGAIDDLAAEDYDYAVDCGDFIF